jgi:hypothetical protein
MMSRLLTAFALCSIVGCADTKPAIDESTLDLIDVEGKADSLTSPTYKGEVFMGSVANGHVTKSRAYHAYDFTYAGHSGLVRLDLKSAVGEDMFLATYKRKNNKWQLVKYNDDCGDGSLNSCMFFDATGGTKYRFVVTTYDAMVGHPIAADYELSVTCKNGDCLQRPCGGFAGLQCNDGEYCHFAIDATCGAADQTGICEAVPEACTEQYAPVCGCNGQTYGNACEAAAAGTSVSATGECPPVACGARAGNTCGDTEYCAYEAGASCGQADAQSICRPRPEVCTQLYLPVCGCDGQTYSNSCHAAAAGTGVFSAGACQ